MAKKDAIKEKIRQGAMTCFERYGLEKTTLDDIARMVGLNKATFYYYYKNKEDIFLEAAIFEGELFLQTLQERVRTKTGIRDQIGYYLQERLNYYTHVLNMNKISVDSLQKLLPGFFELYESVLQKEIKFLTELLEVARQQKEIVVDDSTELATLFIHTGDAVKHATEQKALLQNNMHVDYTVAQKEIQLITTYIFKGLLV